MRCNPEPDIEKKLKQPSRTLNIPDGVPMLNSFYLYLTTGCNLNCRHCWINPDFITGPPPDSVCLDLDLLKDSVAEAKPLGLSHAKLTGGEPLLHPRFREIVDFLTSENIQMNMETNGTLIDAEMAHHLKENTNVHFVAVSFDGASPKTHDAFRGRKGAFQEALEGFRHLVDAGYRPQVIMCPYKGNLHEIEDVVKLAMEIGAGSIKFNPVTNGGRSLAMQERGETLGYEDIINLVRYIRGPLQDRVPIPLFIMIPPALSTIRELFLTRDGGGACRVLHILGILGTGEMALCGIGRSVPELCFGMLGKDRLYDIWVSHPSLLKLREDLMGDYPGICGDCIHSTRCLTNCVAQNYLETGHLVWPSMLCEEAERRGEFPATRRRSYKAG